MKVCKMFKMVDELNVELLFAKTAYTERHLLKEASVKFKNNLKNTYFFDTVQIYSAMCCHRRL